MSELPEIDVFGLGHCCVDYLQVLDPFPEKGRKVKLYPQKLLVVGQYQRLYTHFQNLVGVLDSAGRSEMMRTEISLSRS